MTNVMVPKMTHMVGKSVRLSLEDNYKARSSAKRETSIRGGPFALADEWMGSLKDQHLSQPHGKDGG